MLYTEALHQNWHLQGFTSDPERKYLYWSFTDSVVKTTFASTMIAQVHVSGGHLGDIDYHNGKLYASFLGEPMPGHVWDDWSSFKIYVFDAETLQLERIIPLPICDQLKAQAGKPGDEYGFNAIDGVTFGADLDGNEKMFAACALRDGEQYRHQILLQLSLNGEYERMHLIETGNTVFGIQNLDYDATTGEFWFSTYSASKPYQPQETLYCIAPDLKTVRESFCYSSPYGFECQGNGQYLASLQAGKNANRSGYAYPREKKDFLQPLSEQQMFAQVLGQNT